ncbi:MAG: DUF3302 domain-containing protein [Hyphomicrobiales bacterium]|nr:DUF3302 domain-containing protein [Hyphomicrobiales bacterium]MCP4998486.1 DUF3302 domain-containing protein [Hyphomicrobiales bacterium]
MGFVDWSLTGYDYLTFLFLLVLIIAFFYVLIQLGSLPGKIAERRNHPHAEAVKITGWIGLFTVFPWIHAIIWAMHEATLIDVRSMPDSDFEPDVQKASVYGIPMPAGPAKRIVTRDQPAEDDAGEDTEIDSGNDTDTATTSDTDNTDKPA